MPALSEEEIGALLQPYLAGPANLAPDGEASTQPLLRVRSTPELLRSLSIYLDLLLQWNAKTNLTAIRDPAEIVQRHFGESLFAGLCLRTVLRVGATLLDYGSGAGFPGLPMQLLLPEVKVVLAESQGKKAAFLREAVRKLELTSTVWARRISEMPEAEQFECVTMRAVDDPESALAEGWARVNENGWLLELRSGEAGGGAQVWGLPGLDSGYVRLTHKR